MANKFSDLRAGMSAEAQEEARSMVENEIDTGGPAFPGAGQQGLPNDEYIDPMDGMTLRDYFAAQCLGGCNVISENKETGDYFDRSADIADRCYEIANAMLRARKT